MQRSKFDIPHPDECTACDGTGHDSKGRPEVIQNSETKKYHTQAQGSGCWKCQGTGRIEQ